MSSIAVNSLNNGGGGGGMLNTLTGNSGGAVSPDAFHNINVVGDGTTIDVVGNPGLNTLTISFIGSVAENFHTDDGNTAMPIANTLDILGGPTVGTANINTTSPGAGNQVFIALNESILLPATTGAASGVIGLGAALNANRFMHNYGTSNTWLGNASGNFTTTGAGLNVGIGNLTSQTLTTGQQNVAVGNASLRFVTSGRNNTVIGASAGLSYVSNESSNILVGNGGTVGDQNLIRIGTQGGGNGQQNECFVAGIYNTAISSAPIDGSVVNVGDDGQLGNVTFTSLDGSVIISQTDNSHIDFAATGGGGGGITQLTADSGGPATASSIFIHGGTNITTAASAGNRITINQTNTTVTLNNGNNITVTGGTPLTLGGTASIAVTGTVNHAVLIGNASGSLTSITPIGTASQVLTSNGPGLAPSWQSIPAGGVAAVPFLGIQNGSTPNISSFGDYFLGSKAAMTTQYDIGGNFYPGDGISLPATFTAPETGIYSFTANVVFSVNFSLAGATLLMLLKIYVNNISRIIYYTQTWANVQGRSDPNASVDVSLTAGDVVTWDVFTSTSGGVNSFTINQGQSGGLSGDTFIAGKRIS